MFGLWSVMTLTPSPEHVPLAVRALTRRYNTAKVNQVGKVAAAAVYDTATSGTLPTPFSLSMQPDCNLVRAWAQPRALVLPIADGVLGALA